MSLQSEGDRKRRSDNFDLAALQVVSAADDFQAAVRDALFEQR